MNLQYALPCLLVSDFTSDFRFYDFILYLFISYLLLVFYPAYLLLLSDHTMSLPYLISFAVYLHAPICLCLRHGFQCMFIIRIYRYTCVYLCSPPGFHITTRLGSSDSSGSSCPGFGAWSMWILPVADQSGAAVAWISSRPFRAPSFQALLLGSRVFLL